MNYLGQQASISIQNRVVFGSFATCLIQSILFFVALKEGIGFEYITSWVLLSNLGMLIYYYGAAAGKWPCWGNLAIDYCLASSLLYLFPIFLVFIWVVFSDYQSVPIIESLQTHKEILWIKESRFFFLPRDFYQQKAMTAVFIFALVKYVCVMSGALGILFILPISRGWKLIYARSKTPYIGLYFSFLIMLCLALMNIHPIGYNIDDTFMPVCTAAMMPLAAAAVIGFFRYKFSSEKAG